MVVVVRGSRREMCGVLVVELLRGLGLGGKRRLIGMGREVLLGRTTLGRERLELHRLLMLLLLRLHVRHRRVLRWVLLHVHARHRVWLRLDVHLSNSNPSLAVWNRRGCLSRDLELLERLRARGDAYMERCCHSWGHRACRGAHGKGGLWRDRGRSGTLVRRRRLLERVVSTHLCDFWTV